MRILRQGGPGMRRIKGILWTAAPLFPVGVAASHGFRGGPDSSRWMVVVLSIVVVALTGIIAWETRGSNKG